MTYQANVHLICSSDIEYRYKVKYFLTSRSSYESFKGERLKSSCWGDQTYHDHLSQGDNFMHIPTLMNRSFQCHSGGKTIN